MAKNQPKLDGSGRGVRANKGRGGCKTTKATGQGQGLWRKIMTATNVVKNIGPMAGAALPIMHEKNRAKMIATAKTKRLAKAKLKKKLITKK